MKTETLTFSRLYKTSTSIKVLVFCLLIYLIKKIVSNNHTGTPIIKTNYYTIKQIADELGVTKPAITEYMSKSFCSKYMKNKVTEFINKTEVTDIKQHFVDSLHPKVQSKHKQLPQKNIFSVFHYLQQISPLMS